MNKIDWVRESRNKYAEMTVEQRKERDSKALELYVARMRKMGRKVVVMKPEDVARKGGTA